MYKFMGLLFLSKRVAHSRHPEARGRVGMDGRRLMESFIFELAPAHIWHDFGIASLSLEWTMTPTTSSAQIPSG
jgi:hypothetical protein